MTPINHQLLGRKKYNLSKNHAYTEKIKKEYDRLEELLVSFDDFICKNTFHEHYTTFQEEKGVINRNDYTKLMYNQIYELLEDKIFIKEISVFNNLFIIK